MTCVTDDIKYIIGIDEAGRGPIAGPVAIGACMIPHLALGALSEELVERFMRGELKDSKKLSEKKREEIYKWMEGKQKTGELNFAVSMGSAKTIDTIGIVPTINKAISKALTTLGSRTTKCPVLIRLDGGLKAPDVFKNQETIIKGDENEVAISLASIVAKVTRDRYMKRLETRVIDENNVKYGFDRHKGYGTKAHYEAIALYGLTEEHRRSFCKGVATDPPA